MNGSADILPADRQFFDALLIADGTALDMILDPQFMIIDVGAGGVTARQDFIAAVIDGAVVFDEITTFNDGTLVRHLGRCSVVIGRTAMKLTMPDGSLSTVTSPYTHLYTPDGNAGWRLASAQGTVIHGPEMSPVVTGNVANSAPHSCTESARHGAGAKPKTDAEQPGGSPPMSARLGP